jgi:hypothetical protein
MAKSYELWNTRSGNLLGTFESEEAALEAVRQALAAYGRAYAERLLLGCEDRSGRSRKIAQSAELVERALAVRPGSRST